MRHSHQKEWLQTVYLRCTLVDVFLADHCMPCIFHSVKQYLQGRNVLSSFFTTSAAQFTCTKHGWDVVVGLAIHAQIYALSLKHVSSPVLLRQSVHGNMSYSNPGISQVQRHALQILIRHRVFPGFRNVEIIEHMSSVFSNRSFRRTHPCKCR